MASGPGLPQVSMARGMKSQDSFLQGSSYFVCLSFSFFLEEPPCFVGIVGLFTPLRGMRDGYIHGEVPAVLPTRQEDICGA